jgi:hypothetical protein
MNPKCEFFGIEELTLREEPRVRNDEFIFLVTTVRATNTGPLIHRNDDLIGINFKGSSP